MTENEKKLLRRLDLLFRQMKSCNDELMDTDESVGEFFEMSKEKRRAVIRKSYYFYVSSFGISYIKNLYSSNGNSPGNIMNMRCLIEGISMMFYVEKLSDDEVELFRMQPFILEYQIYKKYEDLHGAILDFSQTEESYLNTKKHYKEKLELNSAKVRERMNQKFPFLDNNKNNEAIVREVLGKEQGDVYKILSIFIHPHDFRNELRVDVEKHTTKPDDPYHEIVLRLLESVFKDFGNPNIYGIEEEYQMVLFPSSLPYSAMVFTNKLQELMTNIRDVAFDKKFTCLGSWLHYIHLLNMDFVLDDSFGYVEQSMIKWKQVLEFFAVLDIFADDKYYLQDNKLLWMYTNLSIARGISDSDNQLALDVAYKEYISRFPNGIEKTKFDKVFSGTLGFLIDEEGNVPQSLTKLVKEFIEKFVSDSDNKSFMALTPKSGKMCDMPKDFSQVKPMVDSGDIVETTLPLDTFLKMCYEESQIMSHATGYLYFANSGAWASGQTLGIYIHKFAQRIINKLYALFQKLRESGDVPEKTFINVVRNYRQKSDDIIFHLEKFYKVPRVKKTF